jgi:hypothetical protein
VAECAIALMWASARGFATMDHRMRAGRWLGIEGVQLTGKTLGLIGFGGVAAGVARLALGSGMKLLAWNRTPRAYPNVEFLSLNEVIAQARRLAHLRLTDETKGILSRQRIAAMKPGVILVGDLPRIILAASRGRMVGLAAEIADGLVFANGSLSHMTAALGALPAAKRNDPHFSSPIGSAPASAMTRPKPGQCSGARWRITR